MRELTPLGKISSPPKKVPFPAAKPHSACTNYWKSLLRELTPLGRHRSRAPGPKSSDFGQSRHLFSSFPRTQLSDSSSLTNLSDFRRSQKCSKTNIGFFTKTFVFPTKTQSWRLKPASSALPPGVSRRSSHFKLLHFSNSDFTMGGKLPTQRFPIICTR